MSEELTQEEKLVAYANLLTRLTDQMRGDGIICSVTRHKKCGYVIEVEAKA